MSGDATATDSKKRIGFLLYPGATLVDFAGATQIFAFGGWECVWYGETLAPITTSENVQVQPRCNFDGHAAPGHELDDPFRLDVLFVPGGAGDGVADAMGSKPVHRFLRRAHEHARWTGSVCVGAFILWAAGILRDCAATTYWSLIPTLETIDGIRVPPYFPRYHLDQDKNLFSGGGVSSSMDLSLELLERIDGRHAAERSQLSVQYAPRPPVDAGDPTLASPTLVDEVRHGQQKGFIQLIADAVAEIQGS